ncbi:S8 family serine peptidase [Zooshikella marina]|uniref:S8 family peptidase n=1 Tax=Zooshikella ganghwensis TaxID=202772 RepID=UPI001BAF0DD9|nr:S8 family serine peptidase [Zooshikella ganghwensis]MBU2705662.1 S8 family serine peptidase [Zooshikella ganghwensis]
MRKQILCFTIGMLSSFYVSASSEKDEILNGIQNTSKVSSAVFESAQSINDINEGLLSLEVYLSSNSKDDAQSVISSLKAPTLNQHISSDGSSFYVVTTLKGLLEISRNELTRTIKSGTGTGFSTNTINAYVPTTSLPSEDYKGKGVKIAVLDSGINKTHPQIQGKIVEEYCFQSINPNNITLSQAIALEKKFGKDYGACANGLKFQQGKDAAVDDHGHGTHVTGIIAASKSSDPNAAPEGDASQAEIISFKVLNSKNSYEHQDLVNALNLLATDPNLQDIKVINLSLGASLNLPGTCDKYVTGDLPDVIKKLTSQGKIIIAASGNEGLTGGEGLPSCLDNTISVAAHSTHPSPDFKLIVNCGHESLSENEIICFSNVSKTTDIAAPGHNIISLNHLSNDTTIMSGTSQATPAVTACVARMLEKNPTLSPADVKIYLQHGGNYIKKAVDSDAYVPKMDCDATLDLVPAMTKK